jgi:hypothetical protein
MRGNEVNCEFKLKDVFIYWAKGDYSPAPTTPPTGAASGGGALKELLQSDSQPASPYINIKKSPTRQRCRPGAAHVALACRRVLVSV